MGRDVYSSTSGQGYVYFKASGAVYFSVVLFVIFHRDARNMARDVQATLLQIVEKHGNKDASEAAEYIKKLQKRGRYLQDVWS